MDIFSKKLLLKFDSTFPQPYYDGSNISSTLFDTSKFAVTASSVYGSTYNPVNLFNNQYASGGDDTGHNKIWECGAYSANANPWIKFSNPYPIKLTSIQFDFRVEWASRVPKAVTIYGGNNNNSWTQIMAKSSFTQERTFQTKTITSPNLYKGYYLYFDGSGGTGQYSVTEIANLILAATYEVAP